MQNIIKRKIRKNKVVIKGWLLVVIAAMEQENKLKKMKVNNRQHRSYYQTQEPSLLRKRSYSQRCLKREEVIDTVEWLQESRITS